MICGMLGIPLISHTITMHLLTQLIATPTSTGKMLIVIAASLHIESMWTMKMGVEKNLAL
jgi:hypothetical protein